MSFPGLRHLNKKILLAAIFLFAVPAVSFSVFSFKSPDSGCIACHGNREKMRSFGYEGLYVTPEMIKRESMHSNAGCNDCHLGNGRAEDIQQAHKGMLKPLFVAESGDILKRAAVFGSLIPKGDDRLRELLPSYSSEGKPVRNVLWHDRDPETLNFDPAIAEKTCGKSGCHAKELEQFRTTVMGTNLRQRTMKTWLSPYGPHNCGPSFADVPASQYLKDAGFDFKNTEDIGKNLNTGFTREQAAAKQKFCNVCHAGCLDCHFTPDKYKGSHSFTKRPSSETCSGNGRGMSMCHPGAMSSRRGEAYIGKDYSVPSGMEPDIHYKNNIHCIDCHQTGKKGMGDIQRKATCRGCHLPVEEAHKKSIHKNLDCAACHISELGGYQITSWGPGHVAGKPNPFKKYSLYYGIQSPPILIRDQKGIWMPVKVWPHSTGNIKEDVKPSGSIMFRWPGGETRDAYYTVGTFDSLPGNNKHLLWLEIEQAAHGYGKARACSTCHGTGSQVSVSTWEFEDDQGAEPFKGRHRITADKKSLRIEDLRNTTPINLIKGFRPEDFAPWLYLKDKWKAPGDFSINADMEIYRQALRTFTDTEKEIARLGAKAEGLDEGTMKQYRDLKGVALHNPEEGKVMIKAFRGVLSKNRLP